LKDAVDSTEKDRQELIKELNEIKTFNNQLRKMVYTPYIGNDGEELPTEFKDPKKFLTIWDNLNYAMGKALKIIMPPELFAIVKPEETKKEAQPQVIVAQGGTTASPVPTPPIKGFWASRNWFKAQKLAIQGPEQTQEKPTITTDKITRDPKEIAYQLLPSLNEAKDFYIQCLRRHQGYKTVSVYLIKHAHLELQKRMTKFFNTIEPFCQAAASLDFRELREAKLKFSANFAQIATAQAMSTMGQQGGFEIVPTSGGRTSQTLEIRVKRPMGGPYPKTMTAQVEDKR